MPKYFDGNRELPFERVAVKHGDLTSEWLEQELNECDQGLSLAVKFEGLSEESLGYIFHIEKSSNGLAIRDIKGIVFFRGLSVADTVKHIRHAAGIEYSGSSQAEFERIRDEIGLDQ